MSSSARLSIRLDPALKQRLVAYSQATGIRLSQIVTQALETHLCDHPDPLEALQRRVEQLEIQVQTLQQHSPAPSAPPSPVSRPDPEPLPESVSETDPTWDPLESSFEDWVYHTWKHLAIRSTGNAEAWGCPITVELLHETGFASMRFRRFIDRLLELEAETPGLQLLPDETSRLGLGDCRPGEVTFTADPASFQENDPTLLPDLPSLDLESTGNGSHLTNGWKPLGTDG